MFRQEYDHHSWSEQKICLYLPCLRLYLFRHGATIDVSGSNRHGSCCVTLVSACAALLAPIVVPSTAPPLISTVANVDVPVEVTLPVKLPVTLPVTAPVKSPVTFPVTAPVTFPVTLPVTFPVRGAVMLVAVRSANTCVTVAPEPPPLNLMTASLPFASSKSFDALYVP